ncbi:MAG: septum formation initiator family protein [Polaribacter sp.]|jgi:cell division protein DivIC|nr:septum formation initiator [Polaribacter sp.]MBT6082498.1 septum formation initiator [Polaribacter sp.]MBT7136174.1 septum formation initiator [Polaribacter sp.]MDG1171355.1 septum formation initiator family protein [Polaribacter sp.]MDG1451633.1 septum formation initiator family protein [Polaribacter sp.]
MTFQGFKNNKVVKILTNLYVIIFIPFLIWMLFFDENSYLIHRKFDNEVQDLERTISFYKKKIAEDKATIEKLQDSLQLEQFAREKYLMKKDNEEIYLIEFNTSEK